MQTCFPTMLAGAASFALIAIATPSVAAGGATHTLTLQLPNGAIEQIDYTGDVPPQVVVSPPAMIAAPLPMPAAAWDPSFAALARMTAIIDQQEAAQEAVLARLAASAPPAVTYDAPPAGGITYVSTWVSDGACTRTTQITYNGNGMAPRTVSDTSGACGPERGAEPAMRAPTHISAPQHRVAPSARLIQARATGAHPADGLVHEAVWRP